MNNLYFINCNFRCIIKIYLFVDLNRFNQALRILTRLEINKFEECLKIGLLYMSKKGIFNSQKSKSVINQYSDLQLFFCIYIIYKL